MRRRAFARFWDEDRGLTFLLIFLVLVVLTGGALARLGFLGETILSLLFTLMLSSGVVAISQRHWARPATVGVAMVAIAAEWLARFSPTPMFDAAAALTDFACVTILAALVFQMVLRAGSVTIHRIIGSVAAYILLGVAWAEIYWFLSIMVPGALSASSGAPLTRAHHLYFSFVTLTTLGYGDIVPVHPFARSLVMLEALTGQLFPAVLIARLVSMELMSREGGRR